MASLNYFLDRTDQSIRSIQSHKFAPPGIFTNAIVKRPNITALLKDPTADESSLYKITKPRYNVGKSNPQRRRRAKDEELFMDIKPERVDGKSIYVDRSFYDQPSHESTEDGQFTKRTVVQLPKLNDEYISGKTTLGHHNASHIASSPTKRGNPPSSSYFSLQSPESNDISVLIEQVMTLLQKYPTLVKDHEGIVAKLNVHQSDFNQVKRQVDQLETEIENQKRELNILNINYSDITSPVRSQGNNSGRAQVDIDEEEFDIDEFISKEEQEIEELEKKLNEKQRM
ncbi:DASH complex subunit Spc34 [Scheffersomyces xylosifermentans]|uniref:DASH complex subunit Spc34 n=1 Tax=Scheffersomyces xylosifermentans TaxID=1304137 RepID=UPI00315D1FAE